MLHGTRLTRQNIHMIASEMDISVEDLENKRIKAKLDYQNEQDKKWTIDKLNKNEEWLEETLEVVQKIKYTLAEDIDYKERTIKMYGWIADQFPKLNLSIPMQTNNEYTRADCMKLILTDPSMYSKIQNWD